MLLIHNLLTSSAIALQRFGVAVPKHDETITLSHPSKSDPDGPEFSFALIAVLLSVPHQFNHTQ